MRARVLTNNIFRLFKNMDESEGRGLFIKVDTKVDANESPRYKGGQEKPIPRAYFLWHKVSTLA